MKEPLADERGDHAANRHAHTLCKRSPRGRGLAHHEKQQETRVGDPRFFAQDLVSASVKAGGESVKVEAEVLSHSVLY